MDEGMEQKIREHVANTGRAGGLEAARRMTPQERTERARMAAYARHHRQKHQQLKQEAEVIQTTIWQGIRSKLKGKS